jgi:adenylyltransferase/sulfurtransferase
MLFFRITPSAPHPVLSAAALAAIYAHARRDYPNECCGMAWGRRDQRILNHVTPCRNAQGRLHAENPAQFIRGARYAYSFEPADVVALQRSLAGEIPARMIYHSHVDSSAYFSDLDQALARVNDAPAYPVEYLVVEVRSNGPLGAKQFAWDIDALKYVEVRCYGRTTLAN